MRNIGRLIVIHDITERKKLEEKLRELSLVDELTGLSNRRGFYILATQFINMAKRMNLKAAVIFGDLDDMKMINDAFGHAEGDRTLVNIATVLRSTSRFTLERCLELAAATPDKPAKGGRFAKKDIKAEKSADEPAKKKPTARKPVAKKPSSAAKKPATRAAAPKKAAPKKTTAGAK